MGAKHVSPEEIVNMIIWYEKLGTYAAVAEKVGRSGSTVSKYVQFKGVPIKIQLTVKNLLNKANSLG